MHLSALLIALGLVLGATTHAHAEPVSTVIGLTALISSVGVSTAVAGAIGGFLLTVAASLGLSVLSAALFRKKPPESLGGTSGKLQTGGVVARAFPFGDKALVTHSLVYWNSFGQDGKTPNAYVALVFALSDLPIGGGRSCVAEIWVNGSQVTWNPAGTVGTYGIAIPEFIEGGKECMWVEVYDGTQTSADSFLVSEFGSDPDRPYTASRVGNGIAYVRVICRVNEKLYSGYPTLKFVCKGVPLYDQRLDDTAGGTGTQRWANKATWVRGVENPVTVAYNVLRGVTYNGSWFFGAQTVGALQLPASAWFAAANECDRAINLASGGSEKQFRCSGEIRLDMEPASVIEDLLRTCNGKLGEIGGTYKPYVGAAGIAVLAITDDDIRTNEDQTFNPFFGLQDIVNSVNGKYIEPGEGWTPKDAPALIDATLEAQDGGRRQPVDLQFEYVPYGVQVQRLMKSALLDYRRERRHVLPLAPEAYRLEPAVDFVSWTSARNGYVNKLFSVEAVTDMDGYMVAVQLKEVDPGDYYWDENVDESPIVIVPISQVTPPAQAIASFAVSAVVVEAYYGIGVPGIRIAWDGTDIDDVIAVEYEIKRFETDALVLAGQTTQTAVNAGFFVISSGLTAETSYQVRARFVPGSGRTTTWSAWQSVQTLAAAVALPALDSALRQVITDMTGFGASTIREILRQFEERLEDQGEATGRALSQTNVMVARAENNATASIVEERSVRASADNANATLITGLSASLSALTTTVDGIETEVTGLATAVTEVVSDVTALDGNLTALSSSLTTLSATVGTVSTTVTTQGAAITDLEGETYGSYGVQITTQQNIIGTTVKKVSGFKLHQAGGAGETVSEFRIDSDRFSVFPAGSDPGVNTYDTPLFTIGSVAGGAPNRAGLNAFAFLDGTLQARMLKADEVVVANTIQLQNSIVTVPHVVTLSAPVTGLGLGVLIDIVNTTFDVTIPLGQTIPIFFNGGMSLEYTNTSTTRWDIDFLVTWRPVGGSFVAESSLFGMTCGTTATVAAPFGGAYLLTGTGAIQQVRARLVWTAASNIRAGNRYLSCQAAKR